MTHKPHVSDDGFTLPELLVAITILGIIMVAIGAMITTSFRTSTTVSAELQGSRGPKVVSRYWVPDVEQANTVDLAPRCGTGDTRIVTLGSPVYVSAFDHPDQSATEATRSITWWVATNGQRVQLVRWVCDPDAAPKSNVVVSDLKPATPPVVTPHDGQRLTISVTVPDRSRTNDEYTFEVTGQSQITTTTT